MYWNTGGGHRKAHLKGGRFWFDRAMKKMSDSRGVSAKQGTEYKSQTIGAGEMAQRLIALTALPEVLRSLPSNHMVTLNHL